MKFVNSLSESEQAVLEQTHRVGATHRVRQRAHAVLLSAKGYSLEQLADIFSVDRDVVSSWLTRWQTNGMDGLADAAKSGRPRKVDAKVEAALVDLLAHPTPNLKSVVEAELKKKKSRSAGPR